MHNLQNYADAPGKDIDIIEKNQLNSFVCIRCQRKNAARLAQTVERGTFNPEVEGSSPSSGEMAKYS